MHDLILLAGGALPPQQAHGLLVLVDALLALALPSQEERLQLLRLVLAAGGSRGGRALDRAVALLYRLKPAIAVPRHGAQVVYVLLEVGERRFLNGRLPLRDFLQTCVGRNELRLHRVHLGTMFCFGREESGMLLLIADGVALQKQFHLRGVLFHGVGQRSGNLPALAYLRLDLPLPRVEALELVVTRCRRRLSEELFLL